MRGGGGRGRERGDRAGVEASVGVGRQDMSVDVFLGTTSWASIRHTGQDSGIMPETSTFLLRIRTQIHLAGMSSEVRGRIFFGGEYSEFWSRRKGRTTCLFL